jgi:hypothetical protein
MVAFLNNANIPLGSQFEDGTRVGPYLTGANITAAQLATANSTGVLTVPYQPYTYDQWGRGMLDAPINNYNIVPRGPSQLGNVVSAIAVTAAGNLTLSGDQYITTTTVSSSSSSFNVVNYLQLDWPRALSVVVAGANLAAAVNITVFGFDFYGVKMQEAVIGVQNIGTYQMKKAFYGVTQCSYNGVATGGGTISIQTTDVYGLPYKVSSLGDVIGIRWGTLDDFAIGLNNNPVIGTLAALDGITPIVIDSSAVLATSNIELTHNTFAGVPGHISAPTRIPGVSFSIVGQANDTSSVDWMVTNPDGQYTATGRSVVLAGGTATTYTSQVQFGSIVHLSKWTNTGIAAGQLSSVINPGSDLVINSTNAGDTSEVNYAIMPASFPSGISNPLANVGGVASVFVPTTQVLDNSKILLTHATVAGTPGVLSVADASINTNPAIGPVGFTITSNDIADVGNTVNWSIVNLGAGNQGTTTLAGGIVTVVAPNVVAGSVILVTYNTFNGTIGTYIYATTIVAGTGFTIASQNGADDSTVNWFIFPNQYYLGPILNTKGVFTPADDTVASNTTGDVRGTYQTSTPANGVNALHFISNVNGFDNFINQQAAVGFNQATGVPLGLPRGGTPTNPNTADDITIFDQMGVQQYTGVQA